MGNRILKIYNASNLKELDNSTRVARYFSYEKLKDIVYNQRLYFCNCELFTDDNERKRIDRGRFKNSLASDIVIRITENLKSKCRAYVSCWTLFDSENVALWKIYDKYSTGACIVTTIGQLKEHLGQDTLISKVIYEEKAIVPILDIEGVASNYPSSEFFKIEPYFFEKEIRAVFYSKSHENGIFRDINFASLVDEVYLSPFASDKNLQKAKKILLSKIDNKKIRRSIVNESKKVSKLQTGNRE